MKRCPQCEFIYEEEQSHCDMDGTALLHDPDALPSISSEPASGKTSKWKGRLWIVGPAIVVALIALVATLPTQTGPTSTGVEVQASQSSSEVPPENAPAASEPNPNQLSNSETNEAVADVDNNTLDGKRRAPSTTTRTRANPSRQPAASNPPATRAGNTSSRDQAQARPTPTPANKKENRIGSFFNKAKKILKKPF